MVCEVPACPFVDEAHDARKMHAQRANMFFIDVARIIVSVGPTVQFNNVHRFAAS
jgi:hypothetical protein